MKFKRAKKNKKNKALKVLTKPTANTAGLNNNTNLKNGESAGLVNNQRPISNELLARNQIVNSNNIPQQKQIAPQYHQLTPQQKHNQAIMNNQIKSVQHEYWKLYNYYCSKFTQYCRTVTNSYQHYINNMIRNTVQQSFCTKMNQPQQNNNGFSELNSSLSNLLYYKLIDNLVNNGNQFQQPQYQPIMVPQYVNPMQYGNFRPYNNQLVNANLMSNPYMNTNINPAANNLNSNNVNQNPSLNNLNNPRTNISSNNNLSQNPAASSNSDNVSSSLLSPEVTNRFKDKLDKILAQSSND